MVGRPRSYHVTWEIDFDEGDCDSPEDAARRALDYIKRDDSIAHVFEVTEIRRHGKGSVRARHTVDLDALDGQQDS